MPIRGPRISTQQMVFENGPLLCRNGSGCCHSDRLTETSIDKMSSCCSALFTLYGGQEAIEIANGALAKAREIGCKPMTVAVVDAGGCLMVLMREDGSGIPRPDIAFAKAWGAVGMASEAEQWRSGPASDILISRTSYESSCNFRS